MRQHLLVSALGVKFGPAGYGLCGRVADGPFSFVALVQLLRSINRPCPASAVLLVTDGARESALPAARQALKDLDIEVQDVTIDDALDGRGVAAMVEAMEDAIPEECTVTLDITHGLRHFPFLYSAAVGYLTGLKGVVLDGVWYGALEARKPGGPAPFVDLAPVQRLHDWQAATVDYVKHGHPRLLAELLEREETARKQGGAKVPGDFLGFTSNLRKYQLAIECGLPFEAGFVARRALDCLSQAQQGFVDWPIPLSENLLGHIRKGLSRADFDMSIKARNDLAALGDTDLGKELERQARLITEALDAHRFAPAATMLREWFVSKAMLAIDRGKNWLQRDSRKRAERVLGQSQRALAIGAPKEWTQELRACIQDWNVLTELRNKLAHCAMDDQLGGIANDGATGIKIKEACEKLKPVLGRWRECDFPPLGRCATEEVVVIVPVGLSTGVVLSAAHCMKGVDRLVALVTDSSSTDLNGLRNQLGVIKLDPIVVKPFPGTNPIEELKMCQDYFDEAGLQSAGEVHACLTGGTTWMGVLVQRLFEQGRELDVPGRRFVLVDDRSSEEQRADPWRVCPAVWLDQAEGGDLQAAEIER